MHNITLVCSAHRENGLCNAGELLKILREIEPEVIFVEIRTSDLLSLEAQATKQYAEFALPKRVQLIPVDRYETPEHRLVEIRRDLDRVFDYVAQASEEYRRLDEENDNSENG